MSLGRRAFVPVFDARIIDEYRVVLSRPRFGLDLADVERFIRAFMSRGWAVEPGEWPHPMSDESDRVFLEVSRGASAVLATGNLRHFPQQPWVMSPSAFWDLLVTIDRGRNEPDGQF